MSEFDFVKAVAAVVLGNALTALWVYGVWRIKNYETRMGFKDGRGSYPLRLLLPLIPAPVALIIAGLLF